MTEAIFPAKLLLFGEYTIIQDAQALALPLSLYQASWRWANQAASISDSQSYQQVLHNFAAYLADSAPIPGLDFSSFQQDLAKGLYFHSNIPQGYGLGSSGAVCAAVYQTYSSNTEKSLAILRQQFAQMESFFHGESSGIDPLVAYVQKPVLIHSKAEQKEGAPPLGILELSPSADRPSLFLLDTTRPRQTAPLVKQFVKDCANPYYLQRLESEYMPLVEEAIEAFINNHSSPLMEAFHHISHFQYKYFAPMIPDYIKPLWLEGLAGSTYKLKLCGAGGGGFMLGITNDWVKSQRELANYSLIQLPNI